MLGITPGKQPVHWPRHAPIRAQEVEQLGRKHDVTVAPALALLDADDHAAAVDIADLEARGLRGAQSGRIRRGQRGACFEARHRFEEADDLVGAEHNRQLLRLARIRDSLREFRLLERHAIEKTQRANGLVQRRPRDAASNEMDLERPHILELEPVRRAAEEAAELGDGMHI